MNLDEANQLLSEQVQRLRQLSYPELTHFIEEDNNQVLEIQGPSGTRYCCEIDFCWDGKPLGNVRVIAGIDDGGLRAFYPLTQSFIKAADESFVGESG